MFLTRHATHRGQWPSWNKARVVVQAVAIGLSVCLISGGCGTDPSKQVVPASKQNLQHISAAYFQATDKVQAPSGPSDLTPFLKAMGDPAQILKSPDDGQNYVILWNVDVKKLTAKDMTTKVLAYEKQGTDGKRWVLLTRDVRQLTDDELRQAPFPPGHKAP